ncbi:hypothetical protein COV19_00145 [Candidatus Woesearchaeota archaeon CG10_big_fil_rev_8_21_14_0_10_44_13]|nr:MAG: hypothetical protein COV19_00145 [Candidatus Woesearchaeota archaeon CG10_big_fil_rev_8_21_14_0_10_44_13]
MRKENHLKSRFMLISLTIFIVMLSCVVAQEELPLKPDTYPDVVKVIPTEPAPQWVIDKMNNYFISMIGEDYFVEHLKLVKNRTLSSMGKSGEKYLFIYNYTHNLKDKPSDNPYRVAHTFNLRADSNGELVAVRGVRYTGPNKPYKFLISKEEAISIAAEFGLTRPFFKTAGSEAYVYYGNQGYNTDTPVEEGTYAWEMSSFRNCIPGKRVEALWVDVDTGDIITTKSVESDCKGEELGSTNDSIQTDNISIRDSIKEINYTEELKERINNFNNRNSSITQRIIKWIKGLFIRTDEIK